MNHLYKFLIAIFMVVTTGFVPAYGQKDTSTHYTYLISPGLGLETGILGIKYAYRFSEKPIIGGVGFGFEGIFPYVKYLAVQKGNWNFSPLYQCQAIHGKRS